MHLAIALQITQHRQYLMSVQVNPLTYNHGTVDPDGDSLVYSLITPVDDFGIPIPYIAPFSPTYPISTTPPNNFILDPITGQMSFTPDAAQVALVAIFGRRISKWCLKWQYDSGYASGSYQLYEYCSRYFSC